MGQVMLGYYPFSDADEHNPALTADFELGLIGRLAGIF